MVVGGGDGLAGHAGLRGGVAERGQKGIRVARGLCGKGVLGVLQAGQPVGQYVVLGNHMQPGHAGADAAGKGHGAGRHRVGACGAVGRHKEVLEHDGPPIAEDCRVRLGPYPVRPGRANPV
jgi:hypothetical protein